MKFPLDPIQPEKKCDLPLIFPGFSSPWTRGPHGTEHLWTGEAGSSGAAAAVLSARSRSAEEAIGLSHECEFIHFFSHIPLIFNNPKYYWDERPPMIWDY